MFIIFGLLYTLGVRAHGRDAMSASGLGLSLEVLLLATLLVSVVGTGLYLFLRANRQWLSQRHRRVRALAVGMSGKLGALAQLGALSQLGSSQRAEDESGRSCGGSGRASSPTVDAPRDGPRDDESDDDETSEGRDDYGALAAARPSRTSRRTSCRTSLRWAGGGAARPSGRTSLRTSLRWGRESLALPRLDEEDGPLDGKSARRTEGSDEHDYV